jgi:formylglycine-generating enzyme
VIPVRGGRSFVGTDKPEIPVDGEGPERAVTLADFGLEAATVTNERFAVFVEATGYVTEAERFGWSAVFFGDREHLEAASKVGSGLPWWHKVEGANWRQPEGQGSSIDGRMDHPVVQVSWNDANAFAEWVGGRLPTEAEWEHAARGGAVRKRFPWGDAEPDDETIHCNIWQGQFPHTNTLKDGYERTAPARSFAPSALGFYSMAGNVWEWTRDAFRVRSKARQAKHRNAQALQHNEKVLKGGSFLCHISYCYRYRIAARMALTPDSGASNAGFRIAYDFK